MIIKKNEKELNEDIIRVIIFYKILSIFIFIILNN